MSTESIWEKFYQDHKGVYSPGHFTDRTDPDGQIYNEYQIRYREELLKHPGEVALELGCGNQPIFEILGAFKEIHYTDISKDALIAAQNQFDSMRIEKGIEPFVHFQVMNVESFKPFKDNSIDLVLNTRAPHRDETSRELMRTLKDSGVYVYQTIGEEDFKDFKLLLNRGRFYDDYLVPRKTRFGVVKESLVQAGFNESKIQLIFDKKYKSCFDNEAQLKEKLWLLVGEGDYPNLDEVLHEYAESHKTEEGKIWVENHRIIMKASK